MSKSSISEKTQNIYKAKNNCQYQIINTPDNGILKGMGIIKNASIYKITTYKFGGPVLLRVGSCEVAIGKDIADKILVRGM